MKPSKMKIYIVYLMVVFITIKSVNGFWPKDFPLMKGPGCSNKGPPTMYGCLRVVPKLTNYIKCFMQFENVVMPKAGKPSIITIPSVFKLAENFTKCRYKNVEIMDDEGFSKKNFVTFLRETEINFRYSNPKDLSTLAKIIDSCINEIDMKTESKITAPLVLENCISNKVIAKCKNDDDLDEGISHMMAIKMLINSLVIPNENCNSVDLTSEASDIYDTCMEKEKETEELSKEFLNQIPIHRKIPLLLFQIPEMKCRFEVSKYYKHFNIGGLNYTALASWVGELDGWTNEEKKKEVQNIITECGQMVDEDGSGTISFHFEKPPTKVLNCFLSRYVNVCGLNNILTKEILVPVLDDKLMSLVANKIIKNINMPAAMKWAMDEFMGKPGMMGPKNDEW